jgi:hypothetical protein
MGRRGKGLGSLIVAGAKVEGPSLVKAGGGKLSRGLVSLGPGLIRHVSQLSNKKELGVR